MSEDDPTCPDCRRVEHKCVCDNPMRTHDHQWRATPMPNPPAQLPAECPPGFRIPEKHEKP